MLHKILDLDDNIQVVYLHTYSCTKRSLQRKKLNLSSEYWRRLSQKIYRNAFAMLKALPQYLLLQLMLVSALPTHQLLRFASLICSIHSFLQSL